MKVISFNICGYNENGTIKFFSDQNSDLEITSQRKGQIGYWHVLDDEKVVKLINFLQKHVACNQEYDSRRKLKE